MKILPRGIIYYVSLLSILSRWDIRARATEGGVSGLKLIDRKTQARAQQDPRKKCAARMMNLQII